MNWQEVSGILYVKEFLFTNGDAGVPTVLFTRHNRGRVLCFLKTLSPDNVLMIPSSFAEQIDLIPNAETQCFGPLYFGLACALKPKVIVETGIYYGYTTAWLALAARTIGAEFYAIDNFSEKNPLWTTPEIAIENLERCGVVDAVCLVRSEALIGLCHLRDTHQLDGLGLVALDDRHSYDHVLAELSICWPFLEHGGIIGSHDTNTDKLGDIGPCQAMTEWSQKEHADIFHFPHSCGVMFIQKR